MKCPCYVECKDCVPGFQKVINLKDAGLVIYRHTAHTKDVDKNTGQIQHAVDTTEDVYILHNTKDTVIASSDYWPEIGRSTIQCPRCKRIKEHAREFLKKGPTISGNYVKGVCKYCKMKDASCQECQEIVKSFVKTERTDVGTDEQVRHWLGKVKMLLEDKSKDKQLTHYDKIYRYPKYPVREPDVEQLFGPHKLDSASTIWPSTDEKTHTAQVHFPQLEKLEHPIVLQDQIQSGMIYSVTNESSTFYNTGKDNDQTETNRSSITTADVHERHVELPYDDDQWSNQIVKEKDPQNDLYRKYNSTETLITIMKDVRVGHLEKTNNIIFSNSTRDKYVTKQKSSSELIKQTANKLSVKAIEGKSVGKELNKTKQHSNKKIFPKIKISAKSTDTNFVEKHSSSDAKKGQKAEREAQKATLIAEKNAKKAEKDARQAQNDAQKAERDAQKAALIAEKNAKIAEKDAQKADRDAQKTALIAEKNAKKSEKDARQAQKDAQKAERDAQKADREAQKAALIAEKNAKKSEKDARQAQNDAQKAERDAQKAALIAEKNAKKSEKDARQAQKDAQKAERDAQKADRDIQKADLIAEQNAKKSEKDARQAQKDAQKAERDAQKADRDIQKADLIAEQNAKKSEKDARQAQKDAQKAERDAQKADRDIQKQAQDDAQKDAAKAERDAHKEALIARNKANQKIKDAQQAAEKAEKDAQRDQLQAEIDTQKALTGRERERRNNEMLEDKTFTNKYKKKASLSKKPMKTEDKTVNSALDDLISKLVKLKQLAHEGRKHHPSSDLRITQNYIKVHCEQHNHQKNEHCLLCANSDIALEFASLCSDNEIKDQISEVIVGEQILKIRPPRIRFQDVPEEKNIEEHKEIAPHITPATGTNSGYWRYSLSDRRFIDNGWTQLPTEKVVRKMNIYRMRPARPEFDWFEHNKNKRLMQYDTGEKLAEFDDNGRGRWFYRNGRMALDYYDAEEQHAGQRFVIYSNGEPDERGRSRPYTLLATFDYLGNGIVFDHSGKIRLKYNQTEGVVLDRSIGPVSHWKWHTLNDPPVLQQVMIDTQIPHKDPEIVKMGNPGEDQHIKRDDEDMLAIEFDNIVKEKSKKLSQEFKPFQIRMKALKINEHFSLRVLDQATVYLLYRDGTTNLKLNIGMVLDNKEIVDTDTADVGDVSNNLEKLPARTESLAGLQKSIAMVRQYDKMRTDRERKLHPVEPDASANKLVAGISRPIPHHFLSTAALGSPAITVVDQCKCNRKPKSTNLYYDTRSY